MTTPLTAPCDQLDQLRAAATPGIWQQPAVQPEGRIRVAAPWGWEQLAEAYSDEDAALIVAAVNALPQLTAALRAVEALLGPNGVPLHDSKTIKVGAIRVALATVAGS